MKISVHKMVDGYGSCNYCEGIPKENGMGHRYNYTEVIIIKGIETSTRFCPECIKKAHELIGKI